MTCNTNTRTQAHAHKHAHTHPPFMNFLCPLLPGLKPLLVKFFLLLEELGCRDGLNR